MSFAKNTGKNIGKKISENLSSKHSKKLLGCAKQSAASRETKVATVAPETASKKVFQRTAKSTSDLIGNRNTDKSSQFQE